MKIGNKPLKKGHKMKAEQLTNEEKFSSRFGFEVGVLVEVEDEKFGLITGYFVRYVSVENSPSPEIEICDRKRHLHDPAWAIPITDIKSIKIRSGPWRVWAEQVRETARFIAVHTYGSIYHFESGQRPFADDPSFMILERPWWAKGAKK